MKAGLQKLGFSLIGLGSLTVVGYLCYYLFRYFLSLDVIPLPIRAAIPAVILGFIILLISVLWESAKRKGAEHFEELDKE